MGTPIGFGNGEGAGPSAFLGGPVSGGQPSTAGGSVGGRQPPAAGGAGGEYYEDLIGMPNLIPQDDDDDGDDGNPPPPVIGVRRRNRLARGVRAVRYDEVFEIATVVL